MFRSLAPHQVVVDALLGTSAVLLRLALGPINSAHVVVVVLMGLAFVLHRLSPGLALGVAWLGALLQVFAVLPPDLANLAILVVLYSTARHGQGIVRWLGLASAGAGALVVAVYFLALSIFPFGLPDGDFLGFSFSRIGQYALAFTFSFIVTIATLGLSWTLGQLVRVADRARESSLQQRIAERTAVIEQERGRIARDMHDVVAHSLAVVIAQADGARYARLSDPEAVDGALSTISTTAREALADVRLLLGQLRQDSGTGPQPMLADLDSLVAQLRASGLDVDVVRSGPQQQLPASQQLAVYRIVQEALTNVLRHGDPAARVVVDLHYTDSDLDLLVDSRLRPGESGPVEAGHGLTGMQERALLVGGSLTAGAEGERFLVRASIPLRQGVPA